MPLYVPPDVSPDLKKQDGRLDRSLRWLGVRIWPAIAVLAGAALNVWLAARAPTGKTSVAEYVVAATASTLAVIGGSYFGKIGRTDPKHARSVVRQLYAAGDGAAIARLRVLQALESLEVQKMVTALEVVEVQMTNLQTQFSNAILDWNDIHPEALRDMTKEKSYG